MQPGQIVGVTCDVASVPFVRAIARSAYERGALYVDPYYFDGVVKRTRLEEADPETLDFVPPWIGGRYLGLGERRAARISIQPNPEPSVLDGVDPALAGRDGLPYVPEILTIIDDRSTNWTVVPYPTQGWAEAAHPELEPAEAVARLEGDLTHVCRLDESDPNAAWQRRADELEAASERLNERRFDAMHFEGPGTDLTIGLLPTSQWSGARTTTADGISHFANVPTEEVWSAPDPERVDGVVQSTKPLDVEGALVRGLVVRFEGGRAVAIDADQNADALRGRAAVDEGAARLGEIALVDREGRIGKLDTVFSNTLLDENAASHIALGNAYASSVGDEDRDRINRSEIHIDFMIGGDDVAVTGITREGDRVPVLREGRWQI
ncbi:MAG TPA: aminopeptidase [Gaiellaceae bacterium]|nr:aminopeptidase [Gaiellaceae bacterium]